MVRLSERLLTVVNMVSPGLKVADVGCDHAHLAIYLVENDISPFVYATDINKGPLESAAKGVEAAGFSDRIKLVHCSGLTGIHKGDAESVVIAGMGGPLMADIISGSKEVCQNAKELILEPQSDPGLLRHFLEEEGYRIISEEMICEENKYYPVIKCIRGKMKLGKEVYYRYGKILLKERNPLLKEHLIRQRRVFKDILNRLSQAGETQSVESGMMNVNADLACVEEALCIMED